jgi:putative sterol carrier protein
MESVEIPELGRASILTLMLKQVLDRNLQDPLKAQAMKNRVLTVRVRARSMKTTLFFEANRVRAEDGSHGKPDLEITGELPILLSLALGESPIRAFLTRRMRVRLRSWRAWIHAPRMISLMQLDRTASKARLLAGRGREQGGSP